MLNCCNFYDIENIEKMCTCIGFKIEEYIEAKNILLEIGIFRLDDNDRISLSIHRLYDPYDSSEPSSWYDTLKNETLPLNSFQIDKRNINLLRQMLNNELNQPVNILLYGEPGTGKTTLVSSMAKELGITVFNVKSSINKNDYDRRLSLYTCVNLASKFNGNALILVDEAERLLDTSIRIDNQDKDKAWLNSFIENSKVSIVWITNDISFVDPAVRRRFNFSLYFPLLDKKQRLKLWNKVLTKYDATRLISRNSLSTLNELFEVPVSVMDRSIDYAKKLASGNREFSSLIKTQLESYISLKEDGLDINEFYKNNKKTDNDKMQEYTTDGVNFSCDIEMFIDGVKRMDSYIKKSKKPKTGCGTMLFYGPPGTGKTELAKYVAKLTKRKAVIKKASDLKDCWVGSTERNIAEAFGNLDIKKELLVIDEVDSFLYDRSIAVRSWESGFVNEFLTQLQEFRGILICTTNNYEGLDPAVMRRFSFKLGFNYSEGEQSEALFNSILMPISGKALSPAERDELLSMKNLTPGDFHVVEDKFCSFFTVSKNAGNKELLKALQEELKLKKDASLKSRHIGFI
jgi:SpoVK/Ycf46/Vps4 family AAA+-type ATPase